MTKKKQSTSEKDFYENKAKLILIRYFSNIYSVDLIHKDKPDLRDIQNSIGIEVTRAFISQILPEQQSLWKNRNTLCVNEKAQTELEKSKISYSCIENKILVETFWVSTKYLIDSFIAKLDRLNSNLYEKFKYYDLFIFSQELKEFDIDDLYPLLDKMITLQEPCKLKYRMVYILDTDIIFCYNLSKKIFTTTQIDNNSLLEINNQAKIEK